MSHNPWACVIRVCDAGGETFGTGFIVSETLALTCAHVVRACGERVRIKFHATGDTRDVQVLRADDATDVAVLQLLPQDARLPDGVAPAMLGMTHACAGHSMRIIGFATPGDYEFDFVEGKILGVTRHQGQARLRLDAKEHLPLEEIAREKGIRVGMSGAPVFDLETARVVGMYSEFLAESPNEWAVPGETLEKICGTVKLHPPQVVEEYLCAVREYCENLPYLALSDVHLPKSFDEMYIPLKARPQSREEEKSDQEESARTSHREPLTIAEVMRNHKEPHVLILGEPGAGKSTLLRHLAQHAWDAPERIGLDAPHLPLLIPLRQLAKDGLIEERIKQALTGEQVLKDLPENFFEEWQTQTNARWLVLLDALDEVPTDARASLMQWLKGWLKTIEPARVVITSRPTGYQDDFEEARFAHYDLLTFEPAQIELFAREWFGDQADGFIKELERARVGSLRGTPLLLTIAIQVYREDGALPPRRSGLYRQFVNIWLREAEERGLKDELNEGIRKVVVQVLARLALAMTEQPAQNSEAVVSQLAAECLRDMLRLSDAEARADGLNFVRVMARRSGAFVRSGGVYDFIHPTFREYLAAVALAQNYNRKNKKSWSAIVSRCMEHNWQEVLLFYLGELSDRGEDVSELVKQVWKSAPPDFIQLFIILTEWWAGALLARANRISEENLDEKRARFTDSPLLAKNRKCWAGIALAEHANVEGNLRDSIIDDLVLCVLRRAHPKNISDLIGKFIPTLVQLGEYQRAIDGLLQLSSTEKAQPYLRMESARALEQMECNVEAIQAWRTLADGDSRTRYIVVEALARLGYIDEAVALWLPLPLGYNTVDTAKKLAQLGHQKEIAGVLLELVQKYISDDEMGDAREAANALSDLYYDNEECKDESGQAWLAVANQYYSTGMIDDVFNSISTLVEMECYQEAAQLCLTIANGPERYNEYKLLDYLIVLEQKEVAERVLFGIWEMSNPADQDKIGYIIRQLCRLNPTDHVVAKMLSYARDNAVDAGHRVDATETLVSWGYKTDAISICLSLVGDVKVSEWYRVTAAVLLSEYGDKDVAISALLQLAHGEKIEPSHRCELAIALCNLGQVDEAIPALRQVVNDARQPEHEFLGSLLQFARVRAAHKLGQLGFLEEAMPTLRQFASNRETPFHQHNIRIACARALHDLGFPDEAKAILLDVASYEKVRAYPPPSGFEYNDWRAIVRLDVAISLEELGFLENALELFLGLMQENFVQDSYMKTTINAMVYHLLPDFARWRGMFGPRPGFLRTIEGLVKLGDERAIRALERIAQEPDILGHRHRFAKKAIRQIRQRLARNANL